MDFTQKAKVKKLGGGGIIKIADFKNRIVVVYSKGKVLNVFMPNCSDTNREFFAREHHINVVEETPVIIELSEEGLS